MKKIYFTSNIQKTRKSFVDVSSVFNIYIVPSIDMCWEAFGKGIENLSRWRNHELLNVFELCRLILLRSWLFDCSFLVFNQYLIPAFLLIFWISSSVREIIQSIPWKCVEVFYRSKSTQLVLKNGTILWQNYGVSVCLI